MISCTFVPSLPPPYREDLAIKNTFNRIQLENSPIIWPEIENNPINEFQIASYIAMAFLTLYPTGEADF